MKISVSVITYNHEKYISKALNSVLDQTIDCEYEILIGEDQSSDNTRKIVEEYKNRYPEKIKLYCHEHPENYIRINGRTNIINNLQQATGEYIALLDGDDYWTDPYKLQKQMQFLNSHPECTMVFHRADWLENGRISSATYGPPTVKDYYTADDLLEHSNFIPTCSVMFRRGLFGEFPEWLSETPYLDLPLHILNAQYGKIGFINESMAVYRVHSGGVYSGRNKIYQAINNLLCYEIMSFHIGLKDNYYYNKYIDSTKYDLECLLVNPDNVREAIDIFSGIVSKFANYQFVKFFTQKLDELIINYRHPKDVVKVSVIICTYNRSDLLKSSIESIQLQNFSTDNFEIIVVDNNSSDDTKTVVESLAIYSTVRIKYVFESRQGLSFARNTGIEHSEAEIVVFTDDDVEAEINWLRELVLVFDCPEIACVGGPIRPLWPFEKPTWINTDQLIEPLTISEFSAAKETGYFSGHYPFGANIAFLRETFKKFGAFSEGLGRQAGKLLSNEEIELCQRIEAAGKLIRFAPNAVIYHKIAPERLTKQWFYHRFYWQGRSDAVLDVNIGRDVYAKLNYCASRTMLKSATIGRADFGDKCHLRWVKGYLHQLLFSDNLAEANNKLRSLRVFETLLVKMSKIASLSVHENCDATDKQIYQLEEHISALLTSWSWRITWPLRVISKLFHSIRNCWS